MTRTGTPAGGSPPAPRRAVGGRAPVLAALLATAVLLVFLPVRENGFLNYDDDRYLTANPVVAAGLTRAGLAWAFTTVEAGNWHPLTWLSHLLDVQLFGMNPGPHHLASAALHAAAAALLALAALELTGALAPSLFVAALFALHPLHVESVAWAAERKDVLMGVFWSLALLAYARYARRPGLARYLALAGCFCLALLAKPAAVTLPAALLLLDFWPLGRLRRATAARLVLEKAPLFALAGAAALVAYRAQDAAGALLLNETAPLQVRLGNAAVAAVLYLRDLLWPARLAHYYPHPLDKLTLAQVAAASTALFAATAVAWALRRRRPALLTGWAWYLVTLAPMLGLVQVGSQARADRYTYLALTGLFLACAWEARAFGAAGRLRLRLVLAGGFLVLATLIPLTRRQIGLWRDTVTLSRHTLAVTQDNWFVQNNLGVALLATGEYAEALALFRQAQRFRPGDATTLNNIGGALFGLGRHQEALYWFTRAAKADPGSAVVQRNLSLARGRLGRPDPPANGAPPAAGEPAR